jgi:ACS family sodium-dependent inorganic phosphate cotransporter
MHARADKTNFTVAIIPMALTHGWTPTVAGLVQSAFFYGFLLMQVPGGMLATRLGGAQVLPRGLAIWSAATASVPFAAGSLPVLCLCRSITGAGEAVAPSSVIDVISRIVVRDLPAPACELWALCVTRG